MKKILTLLFAVVTVAAFAVPTVQKAKKLQPQKAEAKIEMKAQMGDLYTGKAGMMRDFTSGVDTMYLTPVGTFYSAFFPYSGSLFYSFNLALVPGNTELTWTNISTGIASDTYDWVYYNPGIDEEYLTLVEGEKDLVCTFPNYPGWWISPMLYADAYNQADDEAGNYYSFDGAMFMGGKAEQDVLGDGTILTNMYQFSPRADYNDISLTQGMTAGLSEDIGFYTNMVNRYVPDADFAKIVNFVEFFNYPGKPYTFSRIQFYARCTADAGQTLTAKVCRVDDGMIDMDNPIATAVYEFPEDAADDDLAIDFFFEKEDPELGLTEEDWIVVDGDICIVIEGVDKIQEISPFLNAMTQAADEAHDELYTQFCNGYAQWDYYSDDKVIDSRFHPVHCGWYWGSGDDVNLPENLLLSINAQFAYIETVAESATEFVIDPAVGYQDTLKIKASEPYDAWAVDDIPEWFSVEAEDVFETQEDGTEEYTGYTNLILNVPAGNEGQVVYTLPGTSFTIKVGQAAQEPVYYLVGTFNGWSQQDGLLEFVDNEGVLEAVATLEANAEFKVITPNGDSWTWYGGQDDNQVGYFLINDGLMNVPISLVDGANFRIEKAGKYTFQLDPTAMTLTVVPETTALVGDVNGDGEVTAADVTMLYNILLDDNYEGAVNPDQNGDGEITAADVTVVYNVLLGE